MKIDSIETYRVKPRWHFIQIVTDTGVTGWGEITLEGNDSAVLGVVDAFRPQLLGTDPLRITDIWQRLYRGGFYRGGPVLLSAISGIEQALWDIKGKALDVPVYELLGGPVREKIRMYAHVRGDSADETAGSAEDLVNQGYSAMKIVLPGPLSPLENPARLHGLRQRIEAVRDTVGPEVDIALDLHGRSSPAQSIRVIEALGDSELLFFEEPVLPESFEPLSMVRSRVSAALAAGERLYGKWSFFDLISRNLVDVVQPDLSHAGGIQECRLIAAMAESRYISMAPHCPLGPVALAACLQLDAAIPNFLIQEHVTLGDGYLMNDFIVKDGYIELPHASGLGIEVNPEALGQGILNEPWTSPTWNLADGSLADW